MIYEKKIVCDLEQNHLFGKYPKITPILVTMRMDGRMPGQEFRNKCS
jgi:hypothetical protein